MFLVAIIPNTYYILTVRAKLVTKVYIPEIQHSYSYPDLVKLWDSLTAIEIISIKTSSKFMPSYYASNRLDCNLWKIVKDSKGNNIVYG